MVRPGLELYASRLLLRLVLSGAGSAPDRMMWPVRGAAAVGVITETNAEQAIEELKAYEVGPPLLVEA